MMISYLTMYDAHFFPMILQFKFAVHFIQRLYCLAGHAPLVYRKQQNKNFIVILVSVNCSKS